MVLLAGWLGLISFVLQSCGDSATELTTDAISPDFEDASTTLDEREELAARAADILGLLADAIEMQSDPGLPPFRACVHPQGHAWLKEVHGPFSVHTWPSEDDSAAGSWLDGTRALAYLDERLRIQFHDLDVPTHVKFKVIGLKIGVDNLETTLQAHLSTRGNGRATQGDGAMLATWGREGEKLTLQTLSTTAFEWVDYKGDGFAERTKGLMAKAPKAARWLGRSGATWAERVDNIGETPFFGHNGMAVGDVNGDGLEDLYVGMPTGVPNLLLLQQPDGSVLESAYAREVAWLDDTKGALLVDLDGDGDKDLVSALAHVLAISINDGKGSFKTGARIEAPTPSAFYSLAAADVDGDQDVDIYATRYVDVRYGQSVPIPFEDARNGPSNLLILNEGQGRWRDGTAGSGLDLENNRWSLAASFADMDADGDPDLYVANDFGKNQLFRNDDGHFSEVAEVAGVQDQAAGMGVSWADMNQDGHLDLHVTNMWSSAGRRVSGGAAFHAESDAATREGSARHALGNSLFSGAPGKPFRDVSDRAGIRMGRWGWGGIFTDLDADGHPDLMLPNGFLTNDREDDL